MPLGSTELRPRVAVRGVALMPLGFPAAYPLGVGAPLARPDQGADATHRNVLENQTLAGGPTNEPLDNAAAHRLMAAVSMRPEHSKV